MLSRSWMRKTITAFSLKGAVFCLGIVNGDDWSEWRWVTCVMVDDWRLPVNGCYGKLRMRLISCRQDFRITTFASARGSAITCKKCFTSPGCQIWLTSALEKHYAALTQEAEYEALENMDQNLCVEADTCLRRWMFMLLWKYNFCDKCMDIFSFALDH